jgi:hypothetical protein
MQLSEPRADWGKNKRKRSGSLIALGSLARTLNVIVDLTL